ncbi:MAG: matrixin family metalloprotease [Polyangiaceae bacterium]|nr:matrixin family metalloprotease [Polyangiaceae bacterium]
MRRAPTGWFVVAGALCSLLGSSTAHAFCRSNSCDPARGEVCTVDADGCRQGGKLLYWQTDAIPFSVQSDGSAKNKITSASFEAVIEKAFDTWTGVDCGGGKHPGLSTMNVGQTTINTIGYVNDASNANVFLFRDDTWLATVPGSALALTTVSYDWHTGRIYGADVEVNGTGGNITNGAITDGADLPSIILHETGHFFGLDHARSPSATMYIMYEAGKGNLRVLDPDDISGMCAMYPPLMKAVTMETPAGPSKAGCSVIGGRADLSCNFVGLLATASVASAALRRRKK